MTNPVFKKCQYILLHLLPFCHFVQQCYQDLGLWIDFNMKPKTISLYCNAKITMSGPSAESETETWELITIPYASIKQVKIKL